MAHKDYYSILGLGNNASADEIKKAYRRLAMQCHPDRNRGKEEWAHSKFKEINEAFSVLGDPKKRSQYDAFGAAGDIEDIFGGQTVAASFEGFMDDFGRDGREFDFFDNVLGEELRGTGFAYRAFRRGFSRTTGRTRFETRQGIDLEDLFKETQSPGASSINYEIVLSRDQAFMGMEKELIRKGKRLKVKIPAGIKTGSRIRLKNALNTTDGQPGDIIVRIWVK